MDTIPISINNEKTCQVGVKANTLVRLKRLRRVPRESMDSVITRLLDGEVYDGDK